MSSQPRWLAAYLAAGLPLLGLYPFLDEVAGAWAYLAMSLLAVLGIALGVLLLKPSWRAPWLLLAAGQVAFLIGDSIWFGLDFVGSPAEKASLADVAYIAGYPLLAIGLLLFIRARQPRYNLTAGLDALIVGAAGAAILWLLVGHSVWHEGTLPWHEAAVVLAYPLGDVILLSAAAYLLFSGRQRVPAFALLGASAVTLLLADVLWALDSAMPGSVPLVLADSSWLLSYLLFGATALVPSMRQLTQPGDAQEAAEGLPRLIVLGISISVLPVFALVQDSLWGHVDFFLVIPLAGAVVVALLLRMHELVNIHARAEHRYASLLANASDAFAIVKPDGTLLYDSPASLIVLGYPAEGMAGRCILELLAPDERQYAGELLARIAQQNGAQVEAELRVLHADGDWRWLSILATNRLDDPVIAGIVLNYRDVTERREAEQRLRLQARVLEEVKHAVVVTDPDGLVTYWNPAAETQFGWARDEVMGRPLVELTKPLDAGQATAITRVLSQGGRWSGELDLKRKDGSRLTAMVTDSAIVEPDGSVSGIIGVSFDISDRKQLEMRLQEQAFSDALTGLANRALFLDRLSNGLSRSRRAGQRLAVLFLDIDDFKTINDSMGHGAGDQLLVKVAERIRAELRAGDTAARLGGDEFGILLEDADQQDAEAVAERVLAAVNEPLDVLDREVRITTSLGIATPTEAGHETANDLLRNADLAMYDAKNRRRGSYAMFEPGMYDAALRRLKLKAALERAISNGELELVFQPIMPLDSSRPVGAEALLRWTHPELGPVPAPEVIAVATESGLMVRLGRWVISESLRQLKYWHGSLGLEGDELPYVSINATVGELIEPDYAVHLAGAISDHRLPAESVQIEITEDALMSETRAASPALERLKAIGVRLAIDDFGTGYSSLNYLTRFPLDVLKIDRSFVCVDRPAGGRSDGWAIARSIIELGRSLKLEVVAEGVEHSEEAAMLRQLGCRYGQGYLLGRPMSGAELTRLFRRSARPSSPGTAGNTVPSRGRTIWQPAPAPSLSTDS